MNFGQATIRDWRGQEHNLSPEMYVLTRDVIPTYEKGAVVRLISGVDDNPTPGYHFSASRGYVTVCNVTADIAQWVGVPKDALVKLETSALEVKDGSGSAGN